jgi:hypothetical protein
MLEQKKEEGKTVYVVPTDLEMDDQAKITQLLSELAKKGNPVEPICFLAFADINASQQIRIQEYVRVAMEEIKRRARLEGKPEPKFDVTVLRGDSTTKLLLEAGKELSPEKQEELAALKLRWARDPEAEEFKPQLRELHLFLDQHHRNGYALHVTQIAEMHGAALKVAPAPGQTASMDIYAGFNIRSPLQEFEKEVARPRMVENFQSFQRYVAWSDTEHQLNTKGVILKRRIDLLSAAINAGTQEAYDIDLLADLQGQLQKLRDSKSNISKTAKEEKAQLEKLMDAATPETIHNIIAVYGVANAFNYFKKQSKNYEKNKALVKPDAFDKNFIEVIFAHKTVLKPKEFELAAHFAQFSTVQLASNMALGEHKSLESTKQPLYFAALQQVEDSEMMDMHRKTGSAWNDNDIREILFNRTAPEDLADIDDRDYAAVLAAVVDQDKSKFCKDAKDPNLKAALHQLNHAIYLLKKEPFMTQENTRLVHEAVLAVTDAYERSNPLETPWQFKRGTGKYISQTRDPEWQRLRADDLLGYARKYPENMEVVTYQMPYGVDSQFNMNPDLTNPNKFYKDGIDQIIQDLRKDDRLSTPNYGSMTFTGKVKNMVLFEVHSILDFIGTSPDSLLTLFENMLSAEQYDPKLVHKDYSDDAKVAEAKAHLEFLVAQKQVEHQAPVAPGSAASLAAFGFSAHSASQEAGKEPQVSLSS